jgi:hypothetical protein
MSNSITKTRKAGAEDIILMRLHADRFNNHIPPEYLPPEDKRSRYQVALIIQSCERNSYDCHEVGRTDEFHFWLRTTSKDSDEIINGKITILPSQRWLSLASASSNFMAKDYLQSFGFSPFILGKVDLQEKGGAVIFQDQGQIDWTIHGHGRNLAQAAVDHILNVKGDGPGTAGHHIAASVSDTVLDQPGRVHINTTACEPFLHKGERFPAAIHRMSRLEANVYWRFIQRYSHNP